MKFAAYHHGDKSLAGAIIHMAASYVGSINVPLLKANGQFGTRRMGGNDASQPRYLFTELQDFTKLLMACTDMDLLPRVSDDGKAVEPEYYLPIIPLILVNGSSGIGTGWSTSIPCYSPFDCIHNIRSMLANDKRSYKSLVPWYRGFEGTIEELSPGKYRTVGKARILTPLEAESISVRDAPTDATVVEISELPVQTWTEPYKDWLLSNMSGAKKKSKKGGVSAKSSTSAEDNPLWHCFIENHGLDSVHFYVALTTAGKALVDTVGLETAFKLQNTKSVSTTNMHAWYKGNVVKFDSADMILATYFDARLSLYSQRKARDESALQVAIQDLTDKWKLIMAIVENKVDVRSKKTDFIAQATSIHLGHVAEKVLNMNIGSLNADKVAEFQKNCTKMQKELEELQNKSPGDLWLSELSILEDKLKAFYKELQLLNTEQECTPKAGVKRSRAKK